MNSIYFKNISIFLLLFKERSYYSLSFWLTSSNCLTICFFPKFSLTSSILSLNIRTGLILFLTKLSIQTSAILLISKSTYTLFWIECILNFSCKLFLVPMLSLFWYFCVSFYFYVSYYYVIYYVFSYCYSYSVINWSSYSFSWFGLISEFSSKDGFVWCCLEDFEKFCRIIWKYFNYLISFSQYQLA